MSSQEPVIINDVLKKQAFPSVPRIVEDSDDSRDLDLSSWEVSPPEAGAFNTHNERVYGRVPRESTALDGTKPKQKRWKETALANASLKKKQKRKTKNHSAFDMYPEVTTQNHSTAEAHSLENNHMNLPHETESNALRKSRIRSRSADTRPHLNAHEAISRSSSSTRLNVTHSPVSGSHKRNRSRSPKVRRRDKSPVMPNDYPSRSQQIVDDNSSDDYSVLSYSQIKSIQVHKPPPPPKLETEVNVYNGEAELPARLHYLQVKDVPLNVPYKDNPEDQWKDRQLPQPSYSPLPPPADFSDLEENTRPGFDRHGNGNHGNMNGNQMLSHVMVGAEKQMKYGDDFSPMYASVSKPLKGAKTVDDHNQNVQYKPVKPPRKTRPALDTKPRMPAVEQSYQHPDAVQRIIIHKQRPTLGIAIEGGANTRQPLPRVLQIQPSGAAATSNLKKGHVILEVNQRSLVGLQHQDCARAIAEAFKNKRTPTLELLVTEKPQKVRV